MIGAPTFTALSDIPCSREINKYLHIGSFYFHTGGDLLLFIGFSRKNSSYFLHNPCITMRLISIFLSYDYLGMSNNSGRVKPKERIATEDATVVTLLKNAGAIPLVVSNTPEVCMCWETFNNVTGRTNNPYDIRRTPGGSSGGEVNIKSLS